VPIARRARSAIGRRPPISLFATLTLTSTEVGVISNSRICVPSSPSPHTNRRDTSGVSAALDRHPTQNGLFVWHAPSQRDWHQG
jgi:hypothetical protein